MSDRSSSAEADVDDGKRAEIVVMLSSMSLSVRKVVSLASRSSRK
jgi:hypothetical protein